MAVNTNTNAYAILNELQAQAKGINPINVVDTASFISAGQNMLDLGVDEVMGSISKLIQKTLISARPYKAKLGIIDMDKDAFAFAVRKLSIADTAFQAGSIPVPSDGQSTDPWVVKKANVLEQIFAGQDIWQYQAPSIFRTQLLNAFTSEGELVSFFGAIMTNMYNELEQAKESARRGLIGNLIGAKKKANTDSIEAGTYKHLVTEFNTATGQTLTLADIRKNCYKQFMEFVYATIKADQLMLEERNRIYQTQITGKEITRHTPRADQKLVMLAPEAMNISASVLANTFNKELLDYGTDVEYISYWQNIKTPATVKVAPVLLKKDGTLENVASENAITCDNVFAVLFDKECLGMTTIEESVLSTPLNPKGKYINTFAEAQIKLYTDFTESAIVYALD